MKNRLLNLFDDVESDKSAINHHYAMVVHKGKKITKTSINESRRSMIGGEIFSSIHAERSAVWASKKLCFLWR